MSRHVSAAWPLAALLALAPLGRAGAAEIDALGGSFDEPVTGIREDGGKLVVQTGRRALPLESVKSIRFQPDPAPSERPEAKLVLVNGDAVRGVIEGGNQEAIAVRSAGLGELSVPLEQVRAVLTAGATPERERALLAMLKASAEIDWVLLRNGGTVRGSVVGVDGTSVTVDTNVEGGSRMDTLSFDFEKVELISIAPLDEPPPPSDALAVSLRLTDGSRLRGRLRGLDQNTFKLDHPLAKGKPLELPLARVVELSVLNGLFVYLSDLEPSQVDQHFPPEFTYEVEVWGYKRDLNVSGGPLRLEGRTYAKGLGVHSYCALTYALSGGFAEFRAVVGLDDSTRYLGEPGFGATLFRVLVDGKPAKEYPAGVVQRKGQPPTELLVDVKGKRTLTLVADLDPTSLHVLGRADWGDAHLIRNK